MLEALRIREGKLEEGEQGAPIIEFVRERGKCSRILEK